MNKIPRFFFKILGLLFFSTTQLIAQEKLLFSGYQWLIKDSYINETGPGYNFFSSSKQNVKINSNGHLQLCINNKGKKWYCAEVYSDGFFSYGTFAFELQHTPKNMRDIVLGLFIYSSDSSTIKNEIDIEFTKWGVENKVNSQFAIHRDTTLLNIIRFNTSKSSKTSHIINWNTDSIIFKSYYCNLDEINSKEPYAIFSLKNTLTPVPLRERIHINFWVYNHHNIAMRKHKAIISKFSYSPLCEIGK